MRDFDPLRLNYRNNERAALGRLGLCLVATLVFLATVFAAALLWMMGARLAATSPPLGLALSCSAAFGIAAGVWRVRVAQEDVQRRFDGSWLRVLPLEARFVSRAHRRLIARRLGLDLAVALFAAMVFAAGAAFCRDALAGAAVFLASAAVMPFVVQFPPVERRRPGRSSTPLIATRHPWPFPVYLAVWMAERSRSAAEGPILGVIILGGLLLFVLGALQAAPMLAAAGALVASHLTAWLLFDPAIRVSPAVVVLPLGRRRLFAAMALVPASFAQVPAILLFGTVPSVATALLLNVGVLLLNLWMMLVRYAFPESPWRGNIAYAGGLSLMAALPPFGIVLAILLALIATGRRPRRHAFA